MGQDFDCIRWGPHNPSGIKFWRLYLCPFFRKKSDVCQKIDFLSSYANFPHGEKIERMAKCPPHLLAKFEPHTFNSIRFSSKNRVPQPNQYITAKYCIEHSTIFGWHDHRVHHLNRISEFHASPLIVLNIV